MSRELVRKIADVIASKGGRAMLVGGCVRDSLLGKEPKDFDVEVYYMDSAMLRTILESFGNVNAVGESFQVYKLGEIDVSLPRRERKVGRGHKGFEVEGDPHMTFAEASSRRDFTINALMEDALTGELYDYYEGEKDLREGIIRVVSKDSFQEDSLRVLRLIQFASRFEFDIAPETMELAEAVDLKDLPKERLWMEIEKLLFKSVNPSIGVSYLVGMKNVREVIPDIVLDSEVASALNRVKSMTYFDKFSYGKQVALLLSVMLYKSKLTSLDSLGIHTFENYRTKEQVTLVTDFLKQGKLLENLSDYDIHLLSQKIDMSLLVESLAVTYLDFFAVSKFGNRVAKLGVMDEPLKPILKGSHLLDEGLVQGKRMGEILKFVYDLQLQGKVQSLEFAIKIAKTINK